jgi:hypothetical protein
MNATEFKKRTKKLALRAIKLVAELLKDLKSRIQNSKSQVLSEVWGNSY